MPIWMAVDAIGIRIVDVRDERAAVHMAHAHAELTGSLGVALVTAGPGVTNAMTGIANAHVARASMLVLSGVPPRHQENRGALQDIVHTELARSVTRYARSVREASAVLRELDGIDTAVRHRAPLLIVVANNGAWQIEVDDQARTYGRVVGTRLQFSDHAAMARAFGMHAERVERAADLAGALDRAFASRPALLDVVVTPEAVSADAKSGLAIVPDLQPLTAWDDAERHWRSAPPA